MGAARSPPGDANRPGCRYLDYEFGNGHGGAGYVGEALVPKLLARGHRVTVLDLFSYGREALATMRGAENLREIEGDLRSRDTVKRALEGCDAVIHLACI